MSSSPPRATFWRQKSPASSYWRCEIPARHLPGRVNKLIPQDLVEKDGEFRLEGQAGPVAIWQYAGNATRGMLMALQQEQGIRVLLEVDDNYLVPAPGMNSDWQVDFARGGDTEHGDRHSLAAHRRIAEWVDGVVCSTGRLCDLYAGINPNLYLCPNSIDPDDWAAPSPRDDDVLRIGWVASHSHFVDAPLARRAMEWAVKQPNVEVYLVGYQPEWRGPFKRVGWTDSIGEYRELIAGLGLDVGICPLVGNPWANCKSDVKALEMATVGALPVMSDVEPYRPWKNKPGVFCATAKDWEKALRWCVFSRDEVRAAASEAREYVMAERVIQKAVRGWAEACSVSTPEEPSTFSTPATRTS